MPKVSIGEVDLWYEFNGAGETVIQVGGAVSAHEGYATITPRLSEHYRVLDYDHRGYGLSNRPEQQYTLSTWSDDLVALTVFFTRRCQWVVLGRKISVLGTGCGSCCYSG